jgi:hypothetical protein
MSKLFLKFTDNYKTRSKSILKNITQIGLTKKFTQEEAQSLLPLILKITKDSSTIVKSLLNQKQVLPYTSTQAQSLESLIDTEIQQWQNKMTQLGVEPKGLWMADIDSGTGNFCWKYPENTISYHHSYSEGFTNRKRIKQRSK